MRPHAFNGVYTLMRPQYFEHAQLLLALMMRTKISLALVQRTKIRQDKIHFILDRFIY